MTLYKSTFMVSVATGLGGLMFGLAIGGLTLISQFPAWGQHFNYSHLLSTLQVAIMPGCAFLGALASGYLCDRYSRKRTIVGGSLLFFCGSIIQCASFNVPMMVVGRGLCGSSVGMLSTAIPVYQAEMSIPSIRGRLVSLYQWAITWGILLAFWGSYGFRNVEGDASWRIPLGLQAIPAAMLMIWMSFLPYSPRWLVDHYRTSEAHAVLAYLRANGSLTDVLVIEELHEIMMAVKLERDTSMHGYGELVKKPIRRRLIIGIGIQLLQQLTGINIIMYYAPVFFQWLSFTVNDEPFVAQGVVGIVNMLATIPTIIWVDKWGRRPIIILGSALCGLFMILFAVSIATESIDFNRVHLDDVEASKSLSHNLRNLALASIYLFIASFAFSWGVMGWLLPSEIFPMHMRSKANSITAASNWILNFALDFATPFTLCNYPSAIIIVVGGIMVVSAVMLYLIFPETKNRSLEDMELLFTGSLLAFRKPKVIEMGSQYSDRSLSYPKL